ncbi:MAG: redoxin domain-containing protein [Bacteroidales bacterium]|nr:redoxin domain-containing protein [Bacteroidales bacterium]
MKELTLGFVLLFTSLISWGQTPLETAENFTVKDPQGNLYELFDLLDQGKIVMIDFFTTGCGNCQTAAPHVQQAYEYFGCGAGNIEILAINYGATNDEVLLFQQTYGIHTPVISGQHGGGNAVHSLYQVSIYPTFAIIAPDRSIIHQQVYPQTEENFIDLLSAAGGVSEDCTVGLIKHNVKTDQLSIFPVPSSDYISIQMNADSDKEKEIFIYNRLGQLVYQQSVSPQSTQIQVINISEFQKGMYSVLLSDGPVLIAQGRFIVN